MSDSAGTSSSTSTTRPRGMSAGIIDHVKAHKIECGLWFLRILTIVFTLGYFLAIFGGANNCYYKALIGNAAINALRLHQRLGTVRLDRQFLAELLVEDSCHYLFYSMIFLYVSPVSLILLPVLLFAILHAASYSLTLLDTIGQNSWWGARLLISLVEFQSLNILRLIAFTEIILMPYAVIMVLMGRASLLIPFVYYHFLIQRYTSRRNPYTRNMFYELKISIEKTAANPSLPSFIKQFLLGIVNFTIKLAPIQATQQQQQQQSHEASR